MVANMQTCATLTTKKRTRRATQQYACTKQHYAFIRLAAGPVPKSGTDMPPLMGTCSGTTAYRSAVDICPMVVVS